MVSTLIPFERIAKKWIKPVKRLRKDNFRIRNGGGKPLVVLGNVEVYH